MRILIADKFEKSGVEGLKAAGCEVVYQPDLTGQALVEALGATAAEVLVVRSTVVTEAMMDAGPLSLIVRAGAGYNTIDVNAASSRGIYVSNCPGKNAIAVAELAFGLILALDRRIPDNVAELRAGRWNKKEFANAKGLYGRPIGLLGFGNIAQEVARRALAFGMPVVVWSRRYDGRTGLMPEEDVRRAGLESHTLRLAPTPGDVAAEVNILSVHLALAKETRGLVDADLLGRLPRGSFFVNTARAEVIDYRALESAVRERGLRVALDVYGGEPTSSAGEFSDPLVKLPGVYGTHHIGASTEQAQESIAAETVRIVRTYMETGRVPNVVNLCTRTPATYMLVVRHLDRPGVLAHVFDHLRAGNLNVQETENIIFAGAQAAVARINLDGEPSTELLSRMRAENANILDLHLVALAA